MFWRFVGLEILANRLPNFTKAYFEIRLGKLMHDVGNLPESQGFGNLPNVRFPKTKFNKAYFEIRLGKLIFNLAIMPKFIKAYFEIRLVKLGFWYIKLIFNLAIMPNPWDSGKLPKSCIGLPRRISKYALLNFGIIAKLKINLTKTTVFRNTLI